MSLTTDAVVYYSRNSPVKLETQPVSVDPKTKELGPDEVLVKTAYASINPVDVKLKWFAFLTKKTHTLKDFSGTVHAVGQNAAKKFAIGDKVWGSIHRPSPQSYVGSLTVADLSHDILSPIPGKLTLKEAGAIGVVYGTAYQMLQNANGHGHTLGPDSRVLVLGGGTSVGTLLLQIAKKLYSTGTVVATCSARSAANVRAYGADDIIDYSQGSLPQQFKDYVKNHGNQKFDAILDCVGGYDAVSVYPEILKPASTGSTYTSIMGDGGPAATYGGTMLGAVLNMPRTLFRQFFGKYLGINYRIFLLSHEDVEWVERANEFFGIPGVKVPIDSVYPVADLKEAWEKMDSTRASGKIVIEF